VRKMCAKTLLALRTSPLESPCITLLTLLRFFQ